MMSWNMDRTASRENMEPASMWSCLIMWKKMIFSKLLKKEGKEWGKLHVKGLIMRLVQQK